MANEKDLAMLTIDGVSMRNVFTDKDIGKILWKNSSLALSANVPANSDPVTVTKPGAYLVLSRGSFNTGGLTGNSLFKICPNYVGLALGNATVVTSSNQNIVSLQAAQIMTFSEAQVPLQICAQITSSEGRIAVAEIAVVRLALYPDIEE